MILEKYICRNISKIPLKHTVFAVIIIISIFSIACPTSHEQSLKETQSAEESIKKYPRTKEVDDLCTELAKPGKFELTGKSHAYRSVAISHYFYSPLTPPEVRRFYINHFAVIGWQSSSQDDVFGEILIFRKNQYEVKIALSSPRENSNYSFTCKYLMD